MREQDYYFHSVRGRLRVKSPAIKNRPAKAEEVKELLSSVKGVNSSITNTVTGSIVVLYDHELTDASGVLAVLEKKGYFNLSKALSNDDYIKKGVSKFGIVVTKAVTGAFMDTAFQGSALSILSILI
jgi:hypothetical protein